MIAIKGMEEMPSCCYECPYYDDYCKLLSKWEATTEQIRDVDCPLVEIVTCKDCKYRDPEDKFCDCGHMIKWSSPREDDFYCADAERGE